jgi:shikimate dehydrogenase
MSLADVKARGARPTGCGKETLLRITGTTGVVGIIGDPVAQSRSPAIHNAAFAALGIDMVYLAFPVAPRSVAAAVRGVRALGLRGVNVTMPHKQAVVAGLDVLSDDARLLDAVNTIVNEGGRLTGHNTDVIGFRDALRDTVAEPMAGLSAVVLGTGGAARAAAVALLREGVRELTLVARTPAHGDAAAARVRAAGQEARVRTTAFDALDAGVVASADILVNATPLGMHAGGKVPAVLVDNIRRTHIVCDVVYAERPTHLLERARAQQARAIDGVDMLVWQAAASFALWTGRSAPLDVMRGAARQA